MNYGGLNALIDLVNSGDFHILGVPSNVFGLQVTYLVYSLLVHIFKVIFFLFGSIYKICLLSVQLTDLESRPPTYLGGRRTTL